MAIFDSRKGRLNNNNDTQYEVVMIANQQGSTATAASSTSAFNEGSVVQNNPVLQIDGIYGLDDRVLENFTASTGSAGAANSKLTVSTGTGPYGYGVIRSIRTLRYRPGQGALARFTAKFTPGAAANYTQRAGLFTQEQAIQIGYNGNEFGVLRDNGGKAHIEELTITAAAGSPGNVTWTLNGADVVVAVTASDITTNTQEIVAAIPGAWVKEYAILPNGNGVIRVLSTSLGVKAGFSFTDTGTTGLTAATATAQVGVAGNPVWTPQSEFTRDKLDGTGPSGMIIDPGKLNVFQVNFRWLGAGRIQWAVEDPTGCMVAFHEEHYANTAEAVHLDDPSMKLGYVAADLTGAGGTGVTVEGASMMGAIEGMINITKLPSARTKFLATSTNNVYTHVISLKNRTSFANRINLRETILSSLTCNVSSSSGNALAAFWLFYNPTSFSGTHVWKPINENSSIIYYSEEAGTFTLSDEFPVASFEASSASPINIDLTDLRIVIPPQQTVSIAVFSPSGQNNFNGAGAGINWTED